MTSFCKIFDRDAVDDQWRADLTDWLAKCKGIQKATNDELAKWDTLLNSSPSLEDLKSFCDHTGWKYGAHR